MDTTTQLATSASFSNVFGDGKGVRSFLDDAGQPWFVAKDVCEALEIRNTRHAYSRIPARNSRYVVIDDVSSSNRHGDFTRSVEMGVVNESGLYRLILTSRTKAAVEFQDWVTEVVLPSLRKTGTYTVNQENDKLRAERDTLLEDKAALQARADHLLAELRSTGVQIFTGPVALKLATKKAEAELRTERIREKARRKADHLRDALVAVRDEVAEMERQWNNIRRGKCGAILFADVYERIDRALAAKVAN